jgi:hypothetical protein
MGLLIAAVPARAVAQIRVISYGPASAIANAFALTVSDDQYDPCFDEDPPDPTNPLISALSLAATSNATAIGSASRSRRHGRRLLKRIGSGFSIS